MAYNFGEEADLPEMFRINLQKAPLSIKILNKNIKVFFKIFEIFFIFVNTSKTLHTDIYFTVADRNYSSNVDYLEFATVDFLQNFKNFHFIPNRSLLYLFMTVRISAKGLNNTYCLILQESILNN